MVSTADQQSEAPTGWAHSLHAMRVGLISDTHDHLPRLQAALAHFRREEIYTLLHAGDLTSPGTLTLLCGFDLWVARGNMDGDPTLPTLAEALFGPGRLAEGHYLTLDGKTLALLHGHRQEQLDELIRSGRYTYIIHGHTHAPRDERRGPTRVINPGAIGGMPRRPPSYAILDLGSDDLTWYEL